VFELVHKIHEGFWMTKLLLEIVGAAPATVSIVLNTVNAWQQAADTNSRIQAVVNGLEAILAELKSVL
jgi:hypothetical protein